MNKKVKKNKTNAVVPIVEVQPTTFATFIIPFVFSFVVAVIFFAFVFLVIKNNVTRNTSKQLTSESIRKDQYIYESTLDPYDLIRLINMKAPITIVDLRSSAEYKKGHIRGAVSFSREFTGVEYKKFLTGINKKNIVVFYQNTKNSLKPKQMADLVKREGFTSAALLVGWNEWRHFVTMWVPEPLWNTFEIENYIESAQN